MEETVSRREVSVVRTDLRSSSRVVAGAAATSATAATGAAATGTTGAATGAAAATAAGAAADLRATVFFTSAAGATGATTGAATATGASSVFLATRLGLTGEGVAAEFIILVPVEEFILIKRTIPTHMDGRRINFHAKPFNFGNRAHTWNFFSLNGPGG